MLIIEIEKRHNKMVDRIRWDTVSYLPFYYVFFQFLLLTIFNLQANILTTKDILSNLAFRLKKSFYCGCILPSYILVYFLLSTNACTHALTWSNTYTTRKHYIFIFTPLLNRIPNWIVLLIYSEWVPFSFLLTLLLTYVY